MPRSTSLLSRQLPALLSALLLVACALTSCSPSGQSNAPASAGDGPVVHPTMSTPFSGPMPPAAGSGKVLPPGSVLPTEAQCAQYVPASTWEPRPENTVANHTVPTPQQVANIKPWNPAIGMDDKSDAIRRQITGNYKGTTDQILQWVACKWGIDPDIVRAEAVQESYWRQSTTGDPTADTSACPPNPATSGSQCYQSYGILQIKYQYYSSSFPMARNDTALNAEYVYGWIRNCYEGWSDYLYQQPASAQYGAYHAGDIWGCLGFWYSGGWYNSGAVSYIASVKNIYQQKTWLQAGF